MQIDAARNFERCALRGKLHGGAQCIQGEIIEQNQRGAAVERFFKLRKRFHFDLNRQTCIERLRGVFSDFPCVASRSPYCSYCLRARSLGKSTEKCSRAALMPPAAAIWFSLIKMP